MALRLVAALWYFWYKRGHLSEGHALDFATWRSLVRERGLKEEMAVELMVRLVRGAARG